MFLKHIILACLILFVNAQEVEETSADVPQTEETGEITIEKFPDVIETESPEINSQMDVIEDESKESDSTDGMESTSDTTEAEIRVVEEAVINAESTADLKKNLETQNSPDQKKMMGKVNSDKGVEGNSGKMDKKEGDMEGNTNPPINEKEGETKVEDEGPKEDEKSISNEEKTQEDESNEQDTKLEDQGILKGIKLPEINVDDIPNIDLDEILKAFQVPDNNKDLKTDKKKLNLPTEECQKNNCKEFDPVCGSDRVTYTSRCHLQFHKRCDPNKEKLALMSPGPCSKSPLIYQDKFFD